MRSVTAETVCGMETGKSIQNHTTYGAPIFVIIESFRRHIAVGSCICSSHKAGKSNKVIFNIYTQVGGPE